MHINIYVFFKVLIFFHLKFMSYMCINFNFRMHTLNVLCVYVDWEASLPYCKAWIMKSPQNCGVLTNSLGGPTPRF